MFSQPLAPFPAKDAYTVCVSGAAGLIGYSLLPMIAEGMVFGPHRRINLHLLDITVAQKSLNGVKMELQDCAFPLLDDIIVTDDASAAFSHADILILCGATPREEGMTRAHLLHVNLSTFAKQGKIAAAVVAPHCRILVVGNPANTNALAFAQTAFPSIDMRNVSALTRLDHDRALALCAAKAGVSVHDVKNVIIWGNHSKTQVPDATHVTLVKKKKKFIISDNDNEKENSVSIHSVITDNSFFKDEFITTIQNRGDAIIKERGRSSAMSAARAIIRAIHDWILGTPEDGTFVSMAVFSHGNQYGVSDGLFYSFPCSCKEGIWEIVSGLSIDDTITNLMKISAEELIAEKELVNSTNSLTSLIKQ